MSAWLDDGDVRLYHGDAITQLRAMPAGIAQTCVTSPPYWGLRDYGTGSWTGGDPECDHKQCANHGHAGDIGDRNESGNGFRNSSRYVDQGDMTAPECGHCGARRVDDQIGLEPTPELYVERLVAVFREVARVLRPDGTLWLNLGDSYATGTNADRDPTSTSGADVPASWAGRSQSIRRHHDGLKPKDLAGMPWRVAFALQADGWYLRSDIIWAKPNPMPESVTDRPTKAHEYVFLLSRSPRYYWDADAIREPHSPGSATHPVSQYAAAVDGPMNHARVAAPSQGSTQMADVPLDLAPIVACLAAVDKLKAQLAEARADLELLDRAVAERARKHQES